MIISPKTIELKNKKSLILTSPLPENAENLLAHLKLVTQQSYQNMNFPKNHWEHFPIAEEEKILSAFAASPSRFMISAFDGDKIVGNIGCFGDSGEFLKFNARIGMGIQKDHHNIGLGTALLQYAIESASKHNFHRLELTVRTYNRPGIALYEKLGFEKVGLLKEVAYIDGQFQNEYLYQKLLK